MTRIVTVAMAALLLAGTVRGDDPPKKDKEPPKKLSDEEWKEVRAEWRKLNTAGKQAYQQEETKKARAAFETALNAARRLYLKEDFPDGHENLATSLNNLATVLHVLGMAADAEPLHSDALAMRQRLYPKQDHPDVARSLSNLAVVLETLGKAADAEPLCRDALTMYRQLYPKQDHPDVALSLSNLAAVLDALGKAVDAEPLHHDALAMRQRLYLKHDHRDVAISLSNLAFTLHTLGRAADAEPLCRDALAMRQRLYPKQDHRDVAISLGNLAVVLETRGREEDAEPLHRDALAMRQRLYPKQDHRDVAISLSNLAVVLQMLGKAVDAEPLHRDALAMRQRLYPKQDHPDVALSLGNLAAVLQMLGKAADAEPLCRDALTMYRQLYPKQDHPDVALSLSNLAAVLDALGKAVDAEPLHHDALAMYRRLTASVAERKAEGSTLSFITSLPLCRDGYLSSVATRPRVGTVYSEVFADRGAVARIYEQRHFQARATALNSKAAGLLAELAEARQRRSELLFAPHTKDEATLKKRTGEIEGHEKAIAENDKELRKLFPAVERLHKLNKASPADLQKVLPVDVAVVDYLRWVHFEYDAKALGMDGKKTTAKYLAFVVTPDAVKWVHLDTAANIEPAVAAWREAITGDPAKKLPPSSVEKTAELGAKVRELVWAKVRKELPAGIRSVYVCPDRNLCRLPWAALPGDKAGTILLDDFAVAAIPHAPFLLDRLWPQEKRKNPPTVAVAVGGVKYDAELPASPKPDAVFSSRRGEPLIDEKKKPTWVSLPATAGEAEWFTKSAEKKRWPVESLTGEKATPAALLAALPKARYAHLATHGFFADKQFRSAFDLDDRDYQMMQFGERVGRAANNPLVMTGLVLAGANHPKTPNRGIVTGESFIDLDLSGLELVVLSACETGLGDDVTAGEGTFGLQRAFHYAGAMDVVASLWKVDDIATAALMGEFYRQLWEQNQPPVEALRQAQLAVYRADAKRFAELARRGFETGDKDLSKLPVAKDSKGGNHPSLWAAFVLSGYGR